MKVSGILTKEWGCNSNGRSLSRSKAKLLQLETVGTSSNVSSTKKNNLILPNVIVRGILLVRLIHSGLPQIYIIALISV